MELGDPRGEPLLARLVEQGDAGTPTDAFLLLTSVRALGGDVEGARAALERLPKGVVEPAYENLARAAVALAEGELEDARRRLTSFQEHVASWPDPAERLGGNHWVLAQVAQRLAGAGAVASEGG